MRERVLAIMTGKKPDRIPFIDRIDFWYQHHLYNGTMPDEYKELSEAEIYREVGIGQQAWEQPYAYKYHGVEIISSFEGEVVLHDRDPVLKFFPTVIDLITPDIAGVTMTEFITPMGKLSVQHKMLTNMMAAGTLPYMIDHIIKGPEDYRIFEYIIERAEFLPLYEDFFINEVDLGNHGFLTPSLDRIPFQSLLIDVIGETELFYALHDNPASVDRLLTLLDAQTTEKLNQMADLTVPFVEFGDNLDGFMTNPRLFKKYCLPNYQRYSESLHQQGKKMGSHTDGNLQPIVGLIAECGLYVCESFTPAPITDCTFEEAWEAWQEGPIIWGGIPSYYLEERIEDHIFYEYVDHLLEIVGSSPFILGVGDAVMSDNNIDRVRYIAERVEDHKLN
jgi:hypothetical protein